MGRSSQAIGTARFLKKRSQWGSGQFHPRRPPRAILEKAKPMGLWVNLVRTVRRNPIGKSEANGILGNLSRRPRARFRKSEANGALGNPSRRWPRANPGQSEANGILGNSSHHPHADPEKAKPMGLWVIPTD